MKHIFKSTRFKIVSGIIAMLLVGAILAAIAGRGETVQSAVVGTVFTPCHYVAQKIANGIDNVIGTVKGDAQYEKEIEKLNQEIGDLRSQLVDYENLKNQNALYKEFLELKEENPKYKFAEASVIVYHQQGLCKRYQQGRRRAVGQVSCRHYLQGLSRLQRG